MPSNWLSVDSNFPSFTGEESPTQQIRALHNYLYCMKEQLQYSLQNLTADNWNAAALQILTEGTEAELMAQIQALTAQVDELQNTLAMLSAQVAQVSGLPARMSDAEADITALQQTVDGLTGGTETDGRLDDLETTAEDHAARLGGAETALENHEARIQALEDVKADVRLGYLENEALPDRVAFLEDLIDEDVDGNVTLGREGTQLHLLGDIYINGVPLTAAGNEGGVSDETA